MCRNGIYHLKGRRFENTLHKGTIGFQGTITSLANRGPFGCVCSSTMKNACYQLLHLGVVGAFGG